MSSSKTSKRVNFQMDRQAVRRKEKEKLKKDIETSSEVNYDIPLGKACRRKYGGGLPK